MSIFKKITYSILLSFLTLFFVSCANDDGKIKKEKDAEMEKDKKTIENIAILVAEGFHDGEAYMPMGFLLNQGYNITVIGPERGKVKAYNSEFTINIEKAVNEVSPDDFAALILPGGKGPALLRENPDVVDFVSAFNETGKIIAGICHGPQVLITAGLVEGMTCTGVAGIQEELEEAGANYLDQPVVVDRNLITSRVPKDLYDFSKTIADKLEENK